MREFRPRDILWLSCSCSMIFPLSEGIVLTGKTISLWKDSEKLKVQFKVSNFSNTSHLLNTSKLLGRDSFTSVWPMPSYRSHSQKSPALDFMVCCCHLEILRSFWTKFCVFILHWITTYYVADLGSWCLCILSYLKCKTIRNVDIIILIAQSRTLRLRKFPEDHMYYKGKCSQETLAWKSTVFPL